MRKIKNASASLSFDSSRGALRLRAPTGPEICTGGAIIATGAVRSESANRAPSEVPKDPGGGADGSA
jgi:hypothetical protein